MWEHEEWSDLPRWSPVCHEGERERSQCSERGFLWVLPEMLTMGCREEKGLCCEEATAGLFLVSMCSHNVSHISLPRSFLSHSCLRGSQVSLAEPGLASTHPVCWYQSHFPKSYSSQYVTSRLRNLYWLSSCAEQSLNSSEPRDPTARSFQGNKLQVNGTDF